MLGIQTLIFVGPPVIIMLKNFFFVSEIQSLSSRLNVIALESMFVALHIFEVILIAK